MRWKRLSHVARVGPRRPAHQLRFIGYRVRRGPRARQRYRLGWQPGVQPAAIVPGRDPAAPVPGLRQGLHQPGRAGGVRHQVHPERDPEPAQPFRERRRVQVQTDPHIGPLEPEPVAVLPRGHQLHR